MAKFVTLFESPNKAVLVGLSKYVLSYVCVRVFVYYLHNKMSLSRVKCKRCI